MTPTTIWLKQKQQEFCLFAKGDFGKWHLEDPQNGIWALHVKTVYFLVTSGGTRQWSYLTKWECNVPQCPFCRQVCGI